MSSFGFLNAPYDLRSVVTVLWIVVHFTIVQNICTYFTLVLDIASLSGVMDRQLTTKNSEILKFSDVGLHGHVIVANIAAPFPSLASAFSVACPAYCTPFAIDSLRTLPSKEPIVSVLR